MAATNINYTTLSDNYYDATQAAANKAAMDSIMTKYGEGIKWVAHVTNLPEGLIKAFIFIESRGNASARNGKAIGLMQMSAGTASDALVKEKSSGRMNAEEEKIVKKYLGAAWDNAVKKIVPGKTTSLGTWVPESALYQPGFALTAGSIYLGQLYDEFTVNGQTRLDKVVAVYNMGRGAAKPVISFTGSVQDLLKSSSIPTETKNYVKKLMGSNGVLAYA